MSENQSQPPKRHRSRRSASVWATASRRAALAAMLALPAVAHAGTDLFTVSQQTLSNGVTYRLGTLTSPTTYYSGCGNYNSLPYVMVVVGGFGHFVGNPQGETDFYYGKLRPMVDKLKSKCTRVISVETTGWSMFDYTGAISLPAEPTGLDYWVNQPLRRSASFVRAAIMHIQGKPEYSAAPHWYLQGGSASSLHSSKLIDVYRTDADANASGFVFPVAVVLESLPNSGNIWNGCRYSEDMNRALPRNETTNKPSTVKDVLNTVYYVPWGSASYTACQTIEANPTAHSGWKFLSGAGFTRYLNGGRKITIIDGANDPIYKDGSVDRADSWTMDQLLLDFAAVTGKCSGQPFINSSDLAVVNSNRKYQCESRLAAWLYQNGGHGPINNTTSPTAVADAANVALAPGDVRGTIDSVTNNTIYGWACSFGSKLSIPLHLYVGGSAGAGTMIGGYAAANASEPAVGVACGSGGTAHRFAIPLSYSTRVSHVGKKIFIHAIHPTGATPNWLINNSGVFSVPAP